jgi:FMN phosphatase YigB (HAD superfamily)
MTKDSRDIKAVIFDWVGTLYERNKTPYSFSEKVLTTLKSRYKLGLVTLAGQGVEARKKDLEKSGISEYFDCIVIDTEKDKQQFLRCIEKLKATPKTTAIVDDQMRRLKVGIELDCKTYWIQTGEFAHLPPDKETGEPTARINSVKDLLGIL